MVQGGAGQRFMNENPGQADAAVVAAAACAPFHGQPKKCLSVRGIRVRFEFGSSASIWAHKSIAAFQTYPKKSQRVLVSVCIFGILFCFPIYKHDNS